MPASQNCLLLEDITTELIKLALQRVKLQNRTEVTDEDIKYAKAVYRRSREDSKESHGGRPKVNLNSPSIYKLHFGSGFPPHLFTYCFLMKLLVQGEGDK